MLGMPVLLQLIVAERRPGWMTTARSAGGSASRPRQRLPDQTRRGIEACGLLEIRNRFGRAAELDQRDPEVRQRTDVTRIVAAGALEFTARLGELPLLRQREPQAAARLSVGRLLVENLLELRGRFARLPGLEQRQPEIPPGVDVVRSERHDTLEVGDGGHEVAAITGERARLPVAERALRIDGQAAAPDRLGVVPDRDLVQGQCRERPDPGEP